MGARGCTFCREACEDLRGIVCFLTTRDKYIIYIEKEEH